MFSDTDTVVLISHCAQEHKKTPTSFTNLFLTNNLEQYLISRTMMFKTVLKISRVPQTYLRNCLTNKGQSIQVSSGTPLPALPSSTASIQPKYHMEYAQSSGFHFKERSTTKCYCEFPKPCEMTAWRKGGELIALSSPWVWDHTACSEERGGNKKRGGKEENKRGEI